MMWYWGSGMQWWGWLLGAFGMVVFWGLVIWGFWFLVSYVVRRPGAETDGRRNAKQILDERLARGEIDAGEYRHLRELFSARSDDPEDGQEPAETARRR